MGKIKRKFESKERLQWYYSTLFLLLASLISLSCADKPNKKFLTNQDKTVLSNVRKVKLNWHYSSWRQESSPSFSESEVSEKLKESGYSIIASESDNYDASMDITVKLESGEPAYVNDSKQPVGDATNLFLSITMEHSALGRILLYEHSHPVFASSKVLILNHSLKNEDELYRYCSSQLKNVYQFKYLNRFVELWTGKKNTFLVWADIIPDFITDDGYSTPGIDEASYAIGLFNEPRLIENLVSLLHHVNWKVRSATARMFFEGRTVRTKPSPGIWQASMAEVPFLEIKGIDIVPPLIECLKDSVHNVRLWVAGALGKLKDKRATQQLINTLNDPNWTIRLWVCSALGEIGDEGALSILTKLSQHDPDATVKKRAAEAIDQIQRAK
jgi:hypothetical protein